MRAIFSILSLLCVASVAHADDSLRTWLSKMDQAVNTLDYEGTFVYAQGDHVQSMHIRHTHEQGKDVERLRSLDGHPVELIRRGNEVWCLRAGVRGSKLERSPPFKSDFTVDPDAVARLKSYYDFKLGRSDRVAGRETQILRIKARDGYRYARVLWLDDASGLPLRAELRDAKGRPRERIIFTTLKLGGAVGPAAALPKGFTTASHIPPQDTNNWGPLPAAQDHWRFANLPPGYSRLQALVRGSGANRVNHYVFGDGLSTVSVFAENDRASPNRRMSVGAVNSYIRHAYGHKFTVLGEVPIATVVRIAEGIAPKETSQ